jgi:hypothetical protein
MVNELSCYLFRSIIGQWMDGRVFDGRLKSRSKRFSKRVIVQ